VTVRQVTVTVRASDAGMAADENAADGTVVSAAGWFTRLRWPLAAAGGAGLGAAALLLRDPHQRGSWGVCPLYVMTGLYCPACGGLRGTAELLHGNLAGAWADNPFWVGCVPVLVVAWVVWLVLGWRGRSAQTVLRWVPQWAWWLLLGAFMLFGVVRNLPGFPLVPS